MAGKLAGQFIAVGLTPFLSSADMWGRAVYHPGNTKAVTTTYSGGCGKSNTRYSFIATA